MEDETSLRVKNHDTPILKDILLCDGFHDKWLRALKNAMEGLQKDREEKCETIRHIRANRGPVEIKCPIRVILNNVCIEQGEGLHGIPNRVGIPIALSMRNDRVREEMVRLGMFSGVDEQYERVTGVLVQETESRQIYVPPMSVRKIHSTMPAQVTIQNKLISKDVLANGPRLRKLLYLHVLCTRLVWRMRELMNRGVTGIRAYMYNINSVFQIALHQFTGRGFRSMMSRTIYVPDTFDTVRKFMLEIESIVARVKNVSARIDTSPVYARTESAQMVLPLRLESIEEQLKSDARVWKPVQVTFMRVNDLEKLLADQHMVYERGFFASTTRFVSRSSMTGDVVLKFPAYTTPVHVYYTAKLLLPANSVYRVATDADGCTYLVACARSVWHIRMAMMHAVCFMKHSAPKCYPMGRVLTYFYYRAVVDYRSTSPALELSDTSKVAFHSIFLTLLAWVSRNKRLQERVVSIDDAAMHLYCRFHFVMARYDTADAVVKSLVSGALPRVIMSLACVRDEHYITRESFAYLRALVDYHGPHMRPTYPAVVAFLEENADWLEQAAEVCAERRELVFKAPLFSSSNGGNTKARDQPVLLLSELIDLCANTRDIPSHEEARALLESISTVLEVEPTKPVLVTREFEENLRAVLNTSSSSSPPLLPEHPPIFLSTRRPILENSAIAKAHNFGCTMRVVLALEWYSSLAIMDRRDEDYVKRGILEVDNAHVPSGEGLCVEGVPLEQLMWVPTNNLLDTRAINTVDEYYAQQLYHNENILFHYMQYAFDNQLWAHESVKYTMLEREMYDYEKDELEKPLIVYGPTENPYRQLTPEEEQAKREAEERTRKAEEDEERVCRREQEMERMRRDPNWQREEGERRKRQREEERHARESKLKSSKNSPDSSPTIDGINLFDQLPSASLSFFDCSSLILS
jgi:hypothetical protein